MNYAITLSMDYEDDTGVVKAKCVVRHLGVLVTVKEETYTHTDSLSDIAADIIESVENIFKK